MNFRAVLRFNLSRLIMFTDKREVLFWKPDAQYYETFMRGWGDQYTPIGYSYDF